MRVNVEGLLGRTEFHRLKVSPQALAPTGVIRTHHQVLRGLPLVQGLEAPSARVQQGGSGIRNRMSGALPLDESIEYRARLAANLEDAWELFDAMH